MQGLDLPKVSAWLSANVDGLEAPFTAELIAGGRSNLTFKVTDAIGRAFVLRRPPTGHVLATAHDMEREHRIITAVGRTAVPVPKTLGLCTDVEVNDAPFYVMELVDGTVLDSVEKGALLPEELRVATSEHLIDVLADLHAVDVDAVGLGNLAKRDGYIERQVRRWSTQWNNSKTRELASVDEVARRLSVRIPDQQSVAIAHGDFRFGNCLVDVAAGRISGVLDWELCTLGDPLADLGYLGVYWASGGDSPSLRSSDPTGIGGFLSYSDVVARYAARTGLDVSNVGYYVAFSCWRLAVISEGVLARYQHGAMGDQEIDLAQMTASVDGLAQRALDAMLSLA